MQMARTFEAVTLAVLLGSLSVVADLLDSVSEASAVRWADTDSVPQSVKVAAELKAEEASVGTQDSVSSLRTNRAKPT